MYTFCDIGMYKHQHDIGNHDVHSELVYLLHHFSYMLPFISSKFYLFSLLSCYAFSRVSKVDNAARYINHSLRYNCDTYIAIKLLR